MQPFSIPPFSNNDSLQIPKLPDGLPAVYSYCHKFVPIGSSDGINPRDAGSGSVSLSGSKNSVVADPDSDPDTDGCPHGRRSFELKQISDNRYNHVIFGCY